MVNTWNEDNQTALKKIKELLWGQETIESVKHVVKGVLSAVALFFVFINVTTLLGKVVYQNIKTAWQELNLAQVDAEELTYTKDSLGKEALQHSEVEVLISDRINEELESVDLDVLELFTGLTEYTSTLELNVLSRLDYEIGPEDIDFDNKLKRFFSDGGKYGSSEWYEVYLNLPGFVKFKEYLQAKMEREDIETAVRLCHERGEDYCGRPTFNSKLDSVDCDNTVYRIYRKLRKELINP